MPIQIDEMIVRADVQPSAEPSGGAAPASAAGVAQQVRATIARLAALEARTRAEELDD